MTVLDEVRSLVDDPESLQRLEPLLSRLVDATPEDITDADGDPWRGWDTEVRRGTDDHSRQFQCRVRWQQ